MKTRYWAALALLAMTAILVTGYQMNEPYTPEASPNPNDTIAQFQAVQVEQPVDQPSGQPLAAPENTTTPAPQGVCPMTGKTMAGPASSGTHEHCPHSGQPGQTCCPK